MNDRTLDYLMRKMENRKSGSNRGDMRSSRDGNDYRQMRDRESDSRDMYGRRGNVEFEGNMDFRDRRDYERDRRDYMDEEDYRRSRRDTHRMRLSKSDMHDWKQRMENEDGTRGAHYNMDQIMMAAEKLNLKFDEFDEKEFCIAVNMMYSDYCKVAKHYVAPDKELMFFADLAKAFLEDEDAPEGSEKLALYYHCIVDAQ